MTVVAVAAAALASCGLTKAVDPGLTGPSSYGLSITVSASPDLLPRDGQATSTITVTARDAAQQPKRDLGLRMEITINGVPGDLGTLSGRTVFTGSDGRTSITYTAPKAASFGVPDRATIKVVATPIGTDAANTTTSAVTIELVPQGTIVLPNNAPAAVFSFSPTQPTENEAIHFDASASKDTDGAIVSYDWDFGDGSTKSTTSPFTDHAFGVPGTYRVTLVVTDNLGRKGTSAPQTIQIGTNVPSAEFVISPTDPVVGTTVSFNASASKAQPGRSIANYSWDFGDGTGGSGVSPSHAYATRNTFTIVLVVTDNTGRTATTSKTLTVR